MAETTQTPQSMPADEAGPKKKNQKCKLVYLDASGEKISQSFGARSLNLEIPSLNYEVTVNIADLPQEIVLAAAAFGLNTVMRNEVNTAESIEEGAAGLDDRLAGFKEGIWRVQGEGAEREPLIITAMVRAVTEAKWPEEKVEAKKAEWLDHYHSLDKAGKAKQTDAWKGKTPVRAAFEAIKAERAAERAKLAKQGKKKGESLDDL